MVFIPLSDDAPHARRDTPWVNHTIIVLAILAFLWRQAAGGGEDILFERHWGVVPAVAFGEDIGLLRRVLPFLTYMFLHGGWMHLIGNMLFLWIFGDDIEDALGHGRYLGFYVLCGIAGALLYCVFSTLPEAPLVGASGAIAGVMGAYLMIRPCANVRMLVFITVVNLRAMWVIGAWAALQVWHVLAPSQTNTAWWAHIGGLIAGVALVLVMRQPGVRLLECVQRTTFVSPWANAQQPSSRIRR